VIDVLIPTLGRPDRLRTIHDNIVEATVNPVLVWFIVEAHDIDSYEAARAIEGQAVACVNTRTASYAGAINTAYRLGANPWLFAGADDLRFWPGWDKQAFEAFDAELAADVPSETVVPAVIGTNDQLNPYVAARTHATHYLVRRHYLDEIGGVIDEGPGSFQNEGYRHNYVDTEFIATARHRGMFLPCLDSIVEHLHVSVGKTPRDATHDKADASYAADAALYESRCHLWA
jgi:hypothetical protein